MANYEAITIVNRGLGLVNDTFVPVLNLKMNPGLETDPALLNFTWNCVDI
jgi:hypothetical protein